MARRGGLIDDSRLVTPVSAAQGEDGNGRRQQQGARQAAECDFIVGDGDSADRAVDEYWKHDQPPVAAEVADFSKQEGDQSQ